MRPRPADPIVTAPMPRFEGPPDPLFARLNASLGFDRRLWPQDVRSRRRTPEPCSAPACSTTPSDAQLRGPRRRRRRARGAALPVSRRRRGHPHGDRAAADRARRPARRQAAHRSLAQRPGRDRPRALRSRRAPSARGELLAALMERLLERAERTPTGRCPATRTCSAPSPSTSDTTCWPTSGCSRRDAARFAAAARRRAADAARLRRTRGAELGARPRRDRRASSASTRRPRTRSTRSPTATSSSTTSYAAAVCATHLSRIGCRGRDLVEPGVRLLRARRRLLLGLEHHAAEEEPRRGRAAAGEGAADRRRR